MTKAGPAGERETRTGTVMAEKRLSHAYMLLAPEGPERDQAARRLAAELLCAQPEPPCGQCRDCRKVLEGIHPDVTVVAREAGTRGLRQDIVVGQIRAMTADAQLAPNEAARKVYVIDQADRMNQQAQNALLKALEDPPGHACFILCAASADALLPTVRSRCVRTGETAERREQSRELSDLARGYLEAVASGDLAQVVMFCMNRTKLSREDTEAFADQVRDAVCDILCGRLADPGLGRETLLHLDALMTKTEDYLRHNVQPKQIFGLLAAETLR